MVGELDGPFLRKVWKKLRDSSVPIVSPEDYVNANSIADELTKSIEDHLFLPSTIHGYLGIQKGGGVTRFLPVLTSRDMGVYYHLCYSLAPQILINQKGIYGAWHKQPDIPDVVEEEAKAFGQGYGVDPFSSHWWLTEWRKYTDLIRELVMDAEVGKYVVATDIANFYDSIEVPRLISGVRKKPGVSLDKVEALNAFLASWNRRHVGYMPSTKGIPQELLSDASRVLSHFYLQDFDKSFTVYCEANNLTYVRWADDFLIFGGSRQKLESAVHYSSRLLRDLGLNLNSSKTKFMSKSELREYRCLNFLDAISKSDHKQVSKQLKVIKRAAKEGKDFRLDTVFKAMIGYLSKHTIAQTAINRAFVMDTGEQNRDLLHSLNNTQMMNYILLMDKPKEAFDRLRSDICKADFGGPKASYLHMMRRYRNRLAQIGMTKAQAISAINQIEKHNNDSDVVRDICVPIVRQQYEK